MLINARSSVYQLTYHFVFATKYRQTVFESDEQKEDILGILENIAAKKKLTIHKSEAVEDYIHLMVTIPPKIALSDAVKSLKGTSAREWFKKHPETKEKLGGGHLWTPSYYVGSLGEISSETIERYLEKQNKKE